MNLFDIWPAVKNRINSAHKEKLYQDAGKDDIRAHVTVSEFVGIPLFSSFAENLDDGGSVEVLTLEVLLRGAGITNLYPSDWQQTSETWNIRQKRIKILVRNHPLNPHTSKLPINKSLFLPVSSYGIDSIIWKRWKAFTSLQSLPCTPQSTYESYLHPYQRPSFSWRFREPY